MKSNRQFPTIPAAFVVTLAIGSAGGYLLGNRNAPAPSDLSQEIHTSKNSRHDRSSIANSDRIRSRTKSMDQILRSKDQAQRLQGILAYYSNLDPSQFQAEALKIQAMTGPDSDLLRALLFGRWAEVDPLGALTQCNAMGIAGWPLRPTIFQNWAKTDPAAAAKYIAENSSGMPSMINIGDLGNLGNIGEMVGGITSGMAGGGLNNNDPNTIIAREWAAQDSAGALAWAKTLDKNRDATITAIIDQVASKDPQKAISMLSELDPAKAGPAYESIARAMAKNNISDAEEWIKTLPADKQAPALAAAIRTLAANDPQAALQSAQNLEPSNRRNNVIRESFENLAASNPQNAITAFNNLSDQTERTRLVQPIMKSMAMKDDTTAQRWISELPAGNLQDQAKLAYVSANQSNKPKEVLSYAESISDDKMRMNALNTSVAQWMKVQPDAAKEYVQSSPNFDEKAKKRLTSGQAWQPDLDALLRNLQ